jgi:hypothetical protein
MNKIIFFLLIFSCFISMAQEKEESDVSKAAQNATNPLAFVTKLQFQPNYTLKDNGGDQFLLINRIMQPSKTIGLPFIESKDPSKVYTIYRLEAPVLSQTMPNATLDATGLSDFILIDIIAFKQKKGLLGVGPALVMPTASSQYLGSGKWSAGLAAVYMTKFKGLTVGVLGQQFMSFAGDSNRDDQNYMLFQPIVTKVFQKGYFMNFSPIMKFDWEKSDYNIPLSIAFGRAFAKNLSIFIAPEYVVSGPGQGDFTIRLNINTMFATVK